MLSAWHRQLINTASTREWSTEAPSTLLGGISYQVDESISLQVSRIFERLASSGLPLAL
jgi:hypothetical protein